MGLSGDLLDWIKHYLKDRKQVAVVNESNSQGSLLDNDNDNDNEFI